MKKIKKVLSVILSVMMIFSIVTVFASASDTKEVKMLCYNVAGLPSIGGIIGMQGTDVPGNQTILGQQLNQSDYDVIAVQEDFGYHDNLANGLTNYPYKTNHTGGIPGGDGMNVFSKTPIYNEKRITWEKSYGVINDGADELTPKGILYCVLDLGDGIYVDFYNIHADAFGDAGSVEARNDNFRQLCEIINKRGDKRPVIVTGDFNISAHSDSYFTECLIENTGLKDSWVELYNNGDYKDFSEYVKNYGASWSNYWGVWDSVEKFLYKDGGGVHIDVTDFEYVAFLNNGVSISDHKAASATITFTKTADFVENTEELTVTKANPFTAFLKKLVVIIKDLQKIFAHMDDLMALLKG
ncbi:MAG: endonuclease/exonuclease/phosphatase family protein [Acutalibacteraceae bacterium]